MSPVKSKAQYRAMQAAKHGKSTLGIPKSVAEEYVKEAPRKGLPEKVKKRQRGGSGNRK